MLKDAKTQEKPVAWAMRESLHRICYSVVHSNRMNGLSSNVRIVHVREWWRNLVLGAQIASGALIAGGIAWGVLSILNRRKQEPQVSD